MKGSCQHTIGTGFAPEGFPHQHETMPHLHHLIDLHDFLSEEFGDLQVHALTVFLDGLQQYVVVSVWELDPREEVRGDALGWKSKVVGGTVWAA